MIVTDPKVVSHGKCRYHSNLTWARKSGDPFHKTGSNLFDRMAHKQKQMVHLINAQ